MAVHTDPDTAAATDAAATDAAANAAAADDAAANAAAADDGAVDPAVAARFAELMDGYLGTLVLFVAA